MAIVTEPPPDMDVQLGEPGKIPDEPSRLRANLRTLGLGLIVVSIVFAIAMAITIATLPPIPAPAP